MSEDIWIIIVLIGVFYLVRDVNCWYFKINTRKEQMDKMLENQKEIIDLLKKATQKEEDNSANE